MKAQMRKGWLCLLLILTGLSLPTLGWACIFAGPVRIDDQAQAANSILLGTVVETKSYFGANGSIYTDATLRVEMDLKNPSPPAEVIVTVPGGQIGNRGTIADCTPRFSPNDRVLLFLLERDLSTPVDMNGGLLDTYWIKDDQVRGMNLDWLYGRGAAVPLQAFIAQIQAALKP